MIYGPKGATKIVRTEEQLASDLALGWSQKPLPPEPEPEPEKPKCENCQAMQDKFTRSWTGLVEEHDYLKAKHADLQQAHDALVAKLTDLAAPEEASDTEAGSKKKKKA